MLQNGRPAPIAASYSHNGKRQCGVVICQRDGKVLPTAFRSESAALSFIRNRVARETEVMVDESTAWNDLHARYVVKTINHQLAYSDNALARTERKASSAGCVAPRLVITTTLLAFILADMPKRVHGVKITAVHRTAHRFPVPLLWP